MSDTQPTAVPSLHYRIWAKLTGKLPAKIVEISSADHAGPHPFEEDADVLDVTGAGASVGMMADSKGNVAYAASEDHEKAILAGAPAYHAQPVTATDLAEGEPEPEDAKPDEHVHEPVAQMEPEHQDDGGEHHDGG